MTTEVPKFARPQLRQPRLAEMIAGVLRERILSGEIPPGPNLPKQSDLLEEFNVSLPSLREALRILESEGLVTVLRGKNGGGVVHKPQEDNAAQMLGMVLQSRNVRVSDLVAALRALEPLCAVFCAQRPDRGEVVLPRLRELHEETLSLADDPIAFTRVSRKFHEVLIEHCGNQTLILMVGTLESLWSARLEPWEKIEHPDNYDTKVRDRGIEAHAKIMAAIESGKHEDLYKICSAHLEDSLFYQMDETTEVLVRAM